MANCPFCEEDLSASRIFEGKYWDVVLNREQRYLGRSFIMLKRHEEDVFKLSPEERQELWDLARRTSDMLTGLYHPDMFNYAILGNTVRHLHLHVYPRYKDKRVIHGQPFEDERFGQNFGAYEKKEIDKELSCKMVGDMRKAFK